MGMSKNAVVLLSGGIDSSSTLAIAKVEGYECYALSIDYSQRHSIELESAKKVAHALGAKKHLIINFDLREIGGSALTSDIAVPKAGIRGRGSGTSKNINAKHKFPSPVPGSPLHTFPQGIPFFSPLAWDGLKY